LLFAVGFKKKKKEKKNTEGWESNRVHRGAGVVAGPDKEWDGKECSSDPTGGKRGAKGGGGLGPPKSFAMDVEKIPSTWPKKGTRLRADNQGNAKLCK